MTATAAGTSLRPATSGDVDELAALWHRGWTEAHVGLVPASVLPYRRHIDFRRRMPGRVANTITAVDGSRLAGFATVHDDELEQLDVDEPYRARGVAAALLAAAERAIGSRFSRSWLAVVEGNTRAPTFYRRHGWQNSGPVEHSADTADGGTVVILALRYEKTLTSAEEETS